MTGALTTIIGVDLGGTNVRVGRVGLEVDAHAARSLRDTGDRQVVFDDICGCIDQVMTDQVQAIGVGVPALVDSVRGIIYSATNIPSWQEVPLKQMLEDRYHLPTHLNNDANCFALGEFHFGQGKGARYLVGLTIGTGLGAGVVAQGRLFMGAHCGAGEIGNLPFRGSTLEHFVSGPHLARTHGVDGQVLFERAQQGDKNALMAFADFGADLGFAVKALLYTYDPDTIILGGAVSRAFPFFEAALRSALADFAFPHVLLSLRILPTQDGQIPILGAAALCLNAAV